MHSVCVWFMQDFHVHASIVNGERDVHNMESTGLQGGRVY